MLTEYHVSRKRRVVQGGDQGEGRRPEPDDDLDPGSPF